MNGTTIEVHDLTKRFGDFTAVDRISFDVKEGEIFGFLGANGAGKSTAIRMLCGLLEPTSGGAVVGGFDIRREPDKVKAAIGYMSQKFSLYEDLTVGENIDFCGRVYNMSWEAIRERKRWALEMTHLADRERSITGTLSGGWKQRLALGCAVLHQPKIVFLDEPTSGVDPFMRRRFWELINELSLEGVTILVTTHFLEEAEYCNDMTTPILEVQCAQVIEALELIEKEPWALETSVFGSYLHVSVPDEEQARRRIGELLREGGIGWSSIERITPSLEDVFIYLLERESRKAA
jgi:ABC-2 type transport system ATP-binding protein